MWNPLRAFSEDSRWKELDSALTEAFEKIRTERRLVFSWVNYLRKKDVSNEKLQQRIQHTLGRQEEAISDLKIQLKELREELRSTRISPNPDPVRTRSGLESGPVSGLKSAGMFVTKIVSMIRPQKKEYVMQKIMDYVEKGEFTTKQIETIIVREKSLCGRTAFYDYLKELKYKKSIKTAIKHGRTVLVSD